MAEGGGFYMSRYFAGAASVACMADGIITLALMRYQN